jgi:hypothetical protein
MDSFAVTDQEMSRLEATEHQGWLEPEEQVHAQLFLAARVEPVRRDRVADDERSRLRPPERGLTPVPPAHHGGERERASRHCVRDDRVRHVEALRDRGAVAAVAVEQLDHACRLAELASTIDRLTPVERVDEPDVPMRGERM